MGIAIRLILFLLLNLLTVFYSVAQCSMCTKTAQQLGEKPALGLNNGILYLMLAPFCIMGVIIYKWWRSNR